MAFMDRLQTAFKGAVKETFDEDNVSGLLRDIASQSIGSFVSSDKPAGFQIGAQQEIMDRDAREAAAKQAQLEAQREREKLLEQRRYDEQKFRRQKEIELGLDNAKFVRDKRFEAGQKSLELGQAMAQEAAKNQRKFEEVFTENTLNRLGLSQKDVPLLQSVFQANIPVPKAKTTSGKLGKFERAWEEYSTLVKTNDPQVAGKAFKNWYSAYYGTADQQNYERYVRQMEEQNKTLPEKEKRPILSFYNFISKGAAEAGAKDNQLFNDAAKFLRDIRTGNVSPTFFIRNYKGGEDLPIGEEYQPSAQLSAYVKIVNARHGSDLELDHNFFQGAIERYNKANTQKADSNRERGQTSITDLTGLQFLRTSEDLGIVKPIYVSNQFKPKSVVPPTSGKKNENYSPSVGRSVLLQVQNTIKTIASLNPNTPQAELVRDKFGISSDDLSLLTSSYNAETKRFREEEVSDNDTVKNYGAVIRKILKNTGSYNKVKNLMEYMTKPQVIDASLDAGGTEAYQKIEYDPSVLTTFSPLIAATGADVVTLQDIMARTNNSKRPAIVLMEGDNKLVLMGDILGMSKYSQNMVFDVTKQINKTDKKISKVKINSTDTKDMTPKELYRALYNHSVNKDVFEDEETFLQAKLKLVDEVSPKSAVRRTGKNFHLGAAIVDSLLDSSREFSVDTAGVLNADNFKVAGFLRKDITLSTGRVYKKSSEASAKRVNEHRISTELLSKSIKKSSDLLLLAVSLTDRQQYLGKTQPDIDIDNIEPLKVEDLGKLSGINVAGIPGMIQSILTGAKLSLTEAMGGFIDTDYFGNRDADQLATGFGQNVDPKDFKHLSANQAFMKNGLQQAINRDVAALDLEYNQLKNATSITQRDLDIHLTKRKMLWEKISLTYMLAGFVQGDQAGGRTISNEDFATVRDALWGRPLVETFSGFRDQVKYVRETLIDAYDKKAAQLVRMHVQGADIGPGASSLSTIIDQRAMQGRIRISKDPNELNAAKKQDFRKSKSLEEAAEKMTVLPSMQKRKKFAGITRNVYTELATSYYRSELAGKEMAAPFNGINYPDSNFVESDRFIKSLRQLYTAHFFLEDWEDNADEIKLQNNGEIPQVYKDSLKLLDKSKRSNVEKFEALRFLMAMRFEQSPQAVRNMGTLIDGGAPEVLSWINKVAQKSIDIGAVEDNIANLTQGNTVPITFERQKELKDASY
jgi:hypothetical protein